MVKGQTREYAKEELKSKLELYLQSKGIDIQKNFKCLVCDGGHRTPNMGYNKKSNRIHCFACNADMDIIDLIGYETGKSGADLFDYCYAYFNIPVYNVRTGSQVYENASESNNSPLQNDYGAYKAYIEACKASVGQTEYFSWRGLSPEVIEAYNLGYDPAKKAVVIPYGAENEYYITRSLENKSYYKLKGEQEPIFNLKALYSPFKSVFVTEGALDALSVIDAGGVAIALNGTGYGRLINILKAQPTDNVLILSFDNDEAGENAKNKLFDELIKINAVCVKFNISGQYKDPNEALMGDRDSFLQAVADAKNQAEHHARQVEEERQVSLEAEKQKYITESSIGAYRMVFQDQINADVREIPTGFLELDKILDDGLYDGLYIVGAISSLGKTSFVLQVADQIAECGHDVLFFSLEMSKSELIAKSISRFTFLGCGGNTNDAKTTRGITAGKRYAGYSQKERELIAGSTDKYFNFAERYVYISEGIGDIGVEQIKETVQQHVKITGNKPIIFIDYLQILAPVDMRASDKQNTDKAVFELKRLSRDLKIPVVGISSLNRENYNSAISMAAFKESGAIEYSSDVLLGLQFEAAELNAESIHRMKRQQPRKIELKILKNRNGATGDSVTFDYYPMFNYFEETGKKSVDKFDSIVGKGGAKR